MAPLQLYLASASPRRLELLRRLGLEPELAPQSVDERARAAESPRALVLRLAEMKGRSAAARLPPHAGPAVLLAADTVVVVGGAALGKPADAAEAHAMLRRLAGRPHDVLTGVFLLRTDDARSTCDVESTRVRFRALEDATVARYVATGEPLDKAGGYAIQGAGRELIESIEGSWSNVVGLPLERLPEWLTRIGVALDDLQVPAPSGDVP